MVMKARVLSPPPLQSEHNNTMNHSLVITVLVSKTNALEPVVYQGLQWLDSCEVSVPIIILAIRTSHKTPLAASQYSANIAISYKEYMLHDNVSLFLHRNVFTVKPLNTITVKLSR